MKLLHPAGRRLVLAMLPALATALPARADVVHLKTGGVVRGLVTEEADAVTLHSGPGRVTYPRAMIERIEIEPSPLEEYARRRGALPDASADALAELGAWCQEAGLRKQAREAFSRAVRLDPDHEAARRALGYVRWEDRWATEDEFHAALGEVRFRGRWMPREEMKATLESEKAAQEARGLLERIGRERREEEEAARRAEDEARQREERLREEEGQRLAALENRRRIDEAREAARARVSAGRRSLLSGGIRFGAWPDAWTTVVVQAPWVLRPFYCPSPVPPCPPEIRRREPCRVSAGRIVAPERAACSGVATK